MAPATPLRIAISVSILAFFFSGGNRFEGEIELVVDFGLRGVDAHQHSHNVLHQLLLAGTGLPQLVDEVLGGHGLSLQVPTHLFFQTAAAAWSERDNSGHDGGLCLKMVVVCGCWWFICKHGAMMMAVYLF